MHASGVAASQGRLPAVAGRPHARPRAPRDGDRVRFPRLKRRHGHKESSPPPGRRSGSVRVDGCVRAQQRRVSGGGDCETRGCELPAPKQIGEVLIRNVLEWWQAELGGAGKLSAGAEVFKTHAKLLLSKKWLLMTFIVGNGAAQSSAQLGALRAVHAFCNALNYPHELLQNLFLVLYNIDVRFFVFFRAGLVIGLISMIMVPPGFLPIFVDLHMTLQELNPSLLPAQVVLHVSVLPRVLHI
ncbi:hypothetical protein T492DRAFT_46757 [Pavlovales sp. CCMP2436]|nr:hypothetical protein T492DRAFT_46757 [Pavlovales sp. CCMP2436]